MNTRTCPHMRACACMYTAKIHNYGFVYVYVYVRTRMRVRIQTATYMCCATTQRTYVLYDVHRHPLQRMAVHNDQVSQMWAARRQSRWHTGSMHKPSDAVHLRCPAFQEAVARLVEKTSLPILLQRPGHLHDFTYKSRDLYVTPWLSPKYHTRHPMW